MDGPPGSKPLDLGNRMAKETDREFALNPVFLLARSIGLWARGRVHFPKHRVGGIVRDGEDFVIFRQMVVDPGKNRIEEPGATLRVRFHFAGGSASMNKKLSLLPIPFIVGVPGFRSKLWMLGRESGDLQGLYEWDTVATAEAYMRSFAIQLMRRRALPESLSHEITVA